MQEINAKVVMNADVSQAERAVSTLEQKIRGIADNGTVLKPFTEPENSHRFIQNPNATNSLQSIVQNNETLKNQQQIEQIKNATNANDALAKLTENFTKLAEVLPGMIANGKDVSTTSKTDTSKKEKLPPFLQKMKDFGIIAAGATAIGAGYEIQAANTRKKTRALDADVFGMQKEEIIGNSKATGAAITGGSLIAGGIATAFLGPVIGMMVTGASKELGNTILQGVTDNKLADLDLHEKKAQIYQSRLPSLEKNLGFYGTFSSDRFENRTKLENISSFYTEKSKGSGLGIDEFINYANNLASYGNMSQNKSGNIVRNASFIARNTGTDIDSALSFMGTRSRFGSTNTTADINKAYSASIASGLGKGQFGEFLTGLQDAVEQGISKGYITSTDEVSKQMIMFSKLSGNDASWQGKYGFQRLSTINNGLSSATSLGSSSQILAYQALRGIVDTTGTDKSLQGGAYIKGQNALNTLSLMEAGLNTKSFRAISKTMNNTYGDDDLSKVSAWKELTGLNWTGSMKLAKMNAFAPNMTDDELQKKIEELKANQENQTDSTKIKDDVNVIKDAVLKISREGLELYMKDLDNLTENKKKEGDIATNGLESYNKNILNKYFRFEGDTDAFEPFLNKSLGEKGTLNMRLTEIMKDDKVTPDELRGLTYTLKTLVDEFKRHNPQANVRIIKEEN